MRRVGFELAAFCGGVLTLALVLIWLSRSLDPVYAVERYRMRQMLARAKTIEAISLGHSLNRALDFDVLGMNGYHMWESGSDYFEVAYRIRAILPLLPKLKVVFIAVGPTTFFLENRHMQRGDGRRRVYYATTPGLPSWLPINGDVKNLVAGKLADIAREDHWQGAVEALLANGPVDSAAKKLWPVDAHGAVLKDRVFQSASKKMIRKSARLLVESHKAQVRIVGRHFPEVDREACHVLAEMIHLLKTRNVRVIFYTPPISYPFLKAVQNDDVLQAIWVKSLEYLQHLQEEYGIEYFNYIDDRDFVYKYQQYIDAIHLNLNGARRFSRKFFTDCGLPLANLPLQSSAGSRNDTNAMGVEHGILGE